MQHQKLIFGRRNVKEISFLSPTVLSRTTLTRTITLHELLILLGSNHLLCYVPVDDRANDLLTITSVTQVPSDEYDNNSGSTTAAKISVSFRPDLN